MRLTSYYLIFLDNFPVAKVLEERDLEAWTRILAARFPGSIIEVERIL